MSRYASWRGRADDPRSAWGWIVRHDLRIEIARYRLGRRSALMVAGIAVLLVLHKPLMIVSFFAPFLGNFLLRRRPQAEAHGALPTFIESPEALETFPIAMTVWNGRRTTARERGWLSVVEGWLVFEGLRTTVSLKPSPAGRFEYGSGAIRFRLPDGRRVEFRLMEKYVETTLPARRNRRAELVAAVRRWEADLPPEGDEILPSQTLHPEIAGDRIGHSLLACIACALAALFAIAGSVPAWCLGFGIAALAFLVFFMTQLDAFRRDLPTILEDRVFVDGGGGPPQIASLKEGKGLENSP